MMAKYISIYPNSITDGAGLISILSRMENIPWSILTEQQTQDIERAYGIRSGFKEITPSFLVADEETRARILSIMFGEKWNRIFETYKLDYNPLDAYHVTETGERTKETADGNITTYGRSVEERGTDTGTVDTTGNDNRTGTANVYGFNSSTSVPSDTSSENVDTIGNETRNLATSRNLTNSGKDETERNGNEVEEHNITKRGNIGHVSPQELIRQNFEIWKKPFLDTVFADIDSFITLSVY